MAMFQRTQVFRYQNSLSSKAEIADLSAKLKDDVIAIIGLGGTGSAVLDYMVKTVGADAN